MSDPQEAATLSDPHSAEAEARYPDPPPPTPWDYMSPPEEVRERERDAFIAGRVSRDAEVAELRAERDGLLRLREVAHWECDCVPDLGPTHCHACSDAAGHPVEWADSTHGPSAEVAELKAKIAESQEIVAELLDPDPCNWDHNHSCQAHGWFFIPQGEMCPNERGRQYVAASSPVEGGN